MKKIALSLLLTLFSAFSLSAVSSNVASSGATLAAKADTETEIATPIDYADQASIQAWVLENEVPTNTKYVEVTVKTFVDGDTTHFYAEGFTNRLLKARYVAVNTPESTGLIEEWGKKAATFTRSKLENAESIIIESDTADWEYDSTGDRTLSWVWYKAPGASEYRNLNIELLQEGLAIGSKAGETRYGEICTKAIAQANDLKLYVYSEEKDPDYFYGDSIELDLKELRLNTEDYNLKRVAFTGIISQYYNQGVYVESYDEETQMYYGMYVYYGFNFKGEGLLKVGNEVRITGVVTYYETGGSYQVSSLKYNAYKPGDDDIRLLSKDNAVPNTETAPEDFKKKVTITVNENDATTEKSYTYAQLAMNTSISMKGLTVVDSYTTDNDGNNDGAMTLTCKSANGKTINVRTVVLRDENNKLITEDQLLGKTIDVTGIVDYFSGDYQIKVFSGATIFIDGEPLVPPTVAPAPSTPSTSDSETSSQPSDSSVAQAGCGAIAGLSAMFPMVAAVAVLLKKREN